MNKAVFIDKDGTLINDVPYNVNPALITLTNLAVEALKLLQQHGFLLIVISNQSGIAFGYFKEAALQSINSAVNILLQPHSVSIDAFYYCPHHPQGTIESYNIECSCRKPLPGLILRAASDYCISLSESWMIGDILNDVEAGNNAGCKTVLLNNGNETEWLLNHNRQPGYIVENLLEAADIICSNVVNMHNPSTFSYQ